MFEIIPFRSEFQDQLVSLILDIQQIEFGVPITKEDQPDLFTIDDFYRKDGGEFWIAVSGGLVVGSIALIRIGDNAGVIRKMFVRQDFRGREFKVAQKLLDLLVEYCGNRGIQNIYLGTIDRFQAAIRFYAKNGFLEIAKKNLPIDFPLMTLDNVFLTLQIEGNRGEEIQ